jgi:hypothetical protein
MHFSLRFLCVAVVGLGLFTSQGMAQTTPAKTSEPPANATKLELSISKDGRAIVDQNGKVIARFAKGTRVQNPLKLASQKLQGCMRCWNECLIYEGERCVRTIRTCQWDFDCK